MELYFFTCVGIQHLKYKNNNKVTEVMIDLFYFFFFSAEKNYLFFQREILKLKLGLVYSAIRQVNVELFEFESLNEEIERD